MEEEEDDFRLAGCSFTKKLFDILQDPKCSSIITWTGTIIITHTYYFNYINSFDYNQYSFNNYTNINIYNS